MKCWTDLALVLGSAIVLLSTSPGLPAQVCQDEEGMVGVFKKSVADLVETAKKESLQDFENKFHQKSVTSKLSFLSGFTDGLLNCLRDRAKDPATPKEDADAAKAKIEVYSKLKDQIKRDLDALKAARTEKEAKALIERFSYGK